MATEPASKAHQTPFCALDFALGSHPSCSRSTSETYTDLIASHTCATAAPVGSHDRAPGPHSGFRTGFCIHSCSLCLFSPVPHPSLP